MRFRSWWLPAAALAGVLFLSGCSDSPSSPALEIFLEGPIQDALLVGDQVQLQANLSDPRATGPVLWASSDTAVALVDPTGLLRAQRPGSASVSIRLKDATASAVVIVVPRPGGYAASEIDYFQRVAFGFEYGSASEVIRKWATNPRIQTLGSPTPEDLAVLGTVVEEANLLMEEVQIELVDSDPSVEVHFAPVSDFPSILPSYVPGNLGYFSVWFDGGGRITRAVVLLASDEVDQEGRSHLIREEVTQVLGLARDSNQYPTSIFYGPWTTTQAYDPLDEALIEMLYRPQLLRLMEYRPAVDLLRTLTRREWEGSPPDARGSAEPVIPAPGSWEGPETGRGGVGSGGG